MFFLKGVRMSDVLVRSEQNAVNRANDASIRVLSVLQRISRGTASSFSEVEEIYDDVDVLANRATAAAERFKNMGIDVSPYVFHLKMMNDNEKDMAIL